jgi:dolichyl-phosphate-mannose-protein mannosyltransferase
VFHRGNRLNGDDIKDMFLLSRSSADCIRQLSQYTTQFVESVNPEAIQTAANDAPPAQVKPSSVEEANSFVTPQPEQPQVVSHEESIEYRDEAGKLLDPEQVASLQKEGKVSFSTRYETRTRVLDQDGKQVDEDSHAPPHPDVEGQNPETGARSGGSSDEQQKKSHGGDKPASAAGEEGSVLNEKQKNSGQPKPASEGKEATKQAL